jgi:hypothetical protein
MISNGTLQDGCDERHDVRFRKRWRCLLRVKGRHPHGGFNSTRPSNDFPHDLLASPFIGVTNGFMPPLEAQNAKHEGRLISEVNSPSSAVRAAKLQPRRNASLIETPPPI